MPKNHIMLDLETLSTRKDCAIIQIAAVKFDPETGEIGDRFSWYVRDSSGHIDVQTVAWWMQQKHAPVIGAKLAADDEGSEREALTRFAHWCDHFTDGGIVALWSHGATFDIVVLETAYERHGFKRPWSYKIERDTRTLYAIAPGGMPDVPLDEARQHDALYDCERQVAQVCGALYQIELAKAALERHNARTSVALAELQRRGAADFPIPAPSHEGREFG